jgi:hypothetical protein
MWQIQARLKTGTEWEPISVEPRDDTQQRKYHYATPAECQVALNRYLSTERSFPALIVNLAVGKTFLREKYELRFIQIGPAAEAAALPQPETLPIAPANIKSA